MKKASFLLLISCMSFALAGCDFSNDNKANVKSETVPFVNLSADYKINAKNFKLYFVDEDLTFPYVDIEDYTSRLSGFFDTSKFYFLRSDAFPTRSLISNNVTVTMNHVKNTVKVDNFDSLPGLVKSSSVVNYNSYISYVGYQTQGRKEVTFDLGKYGFDILNYKGKYLLPLTITNMIFTSSSYFNLFYNGSAVYSFRGEIGNNLEEYKTIFQSPYNGTTQTNKLRENTVNSLCFAMDYFYGLKKDKNITSFKDYISNNDMLLLNSVNADENFQAYRHILHTSLDDLHTRLDSISYYKSNIEEQPYSIDDIGPFYTNYLEKQSYLKQQRNTSLSETDFPVRYQGDTAIITLDSFKTASNDLIFDNDGKVKEDAWKHDSYWFMDYCMQDIQKHSEINDILLDISLNGGGNIGAMYRVFGFITDSNLLDYSYNTLTNEFTKYSLAVDTNRDKNYADHDSFDNYRWTLLAGINTFSAANALICKTRQVNACKVIGQKSGGGMCTVLPLLLPDGTAFSISSNNTLRYVVHDGNSDIYYSTEYGFDPDLSIPYEDFYNDAELINFVDNVNN